MRKILLRSGSAVLVFAFLFHSCRRDRPVDLAVDFSSRENWVYEFTGTVGGEFGVGDSGVALHTTIDCILAGSSDGQGRLLTVRAERIDITSTVLDEKEMMHIEELISGAGYTVSLQDGVPVAGDSLYASLPGYGEWDLHRHLAKLVPVLPLRPVRPGFTWDRERQFPVATSPGLVHCAVYQSFTLDSVRVAPDGREEACLSWLFRYTLEPAQPDTARWLDRLPAKGTGKGFAVVDITNRCLTKAEMVFRTPEAALPSLSVNWIERASLRLVVW